MPFTQSEPTTRAPVDLQVPTTPSSNTCTSAPSSSVSVRHCRRVLVVGDGNFSYSLALLNQFQQQQQSDDPNEVVDLIATSYDSFDELVAKYPESRRICAQLRARGATVWHRVDATNLRESLVAAGATPQQLRFQSVIFNHPHVGEENVRRHQSLLSHFYASALAVLEHKEQQRELKKELKETRDGIFLTLADGQPERWQAVHRALRSGLVLYREVADVDRDEVFGLVYDRKRHQNGRSFYQVTLYGEKRAQKSTLFIFRRPESGVTTNAVAVNATSTSTAEIVCCRDEKTATSRKRKAERDHGLEFACTQCDRSFKSTQGLRTHVHMVHELGASGAGQEVVLHCKLCSRTFKTEDAKRQHVLAKHGKDPLIQPDWFQKQQQQHEATSAASDPTALSPSSTDGLTGVITGPAAPLAKAKTCAICELSFATVEDFDAHWQELRPRSAVKRKCTNCSREFHEERALRQHQNFCGQKETDRVIEDTDT